mmetsp:Transcript_37008/g.92115  ORF Transcript_37008/g.92115 Transcript_37008/m.92115 type:complete len:209 (+) Transcript_37008:530-1156(+)
MPYHLGRACCRLLQPQGLRQQLHLRAARCDHRGGARRRRSRGGGARDGAPPRRGVPPLLGARRGLKRARLVGLRTRRPRDYQVDQRARGIRRHRPLLRLRRHARRPARRTACGGRLDSVHRNQHPRRHRAAAAQDPRARVAHRRQLERRGDPVRVSDRARRLRRTGLLVADGRDERGHRALRAQRINPSGPSVHRQGRRRSARPCPLG